MHSAVPRNGAACLDRVVVPLLRHQSYANQDTDPPARFDWRLRALSRATKDEKKYEKSSGYLRRLRPINMGADLGKPFFDAIRQYSEKYVAFLSCRGYY